MIAAMVLVLLFASEHPVMEWRNGEIWLVRQGAPALQVTNDGCPKGREISWSPDGTKAAHYTIQTDDHPQCPNNVVLLAADGVTLSTIPGLDRGNAIMRVDWLDNDRIGIDTHITPSSGQYRVVNVATGVQLASYLGYGFRPSLDFTRVAHVGPMPHFAPAFAKSDYLMVDNRVVYPPGVGEEPNVLPPDPGDKLLYRDIREFRSDAAWSTDGNRIALVERLFDWRADQWGSYYGKEENSRWWLLVVPAAGGEALRTKLPALEGGPVTLEWIGPGRVKLAGGVSGEYKVAP